MLRQILFVLVLSLLATWLTGCRSMERQGEVNVDLGVDGKPHLTAKISFTHPRD